MVQNLIYRADYKDYKYQDIITTVQFGEKLLSGYTDSDSEMFLDTKTIGANEVIRLIQTKQIILNELDSEAISQLERIARQKSITGATKYFILGESGKGVSTSDHIFASFICFAICIRDTSFIKSKKKKLGRPKV
jgi:hypothetical protein